MCIVGFFFFFSCDGHGPVFFGFGAIDICGTKTAKRKKKKKKKKRKEKKNWVPTIFFSLAPSCVVTLLIACSVPKRPFTRQKNWVRTRQETEEYGPHIFARVNFADHVFWHGYGPVFFSVLGP